MVWSEGFAGIDSKHNSPSQEKPGEGAIKLHDSRLEIRNSSKKISHERATYTPYLLWPKRDHNIIVETNRLDLSYVDGML